MSDPREMAARKVLRALGLDVESVNPISRSDADEFAAVVVSNPDSHPEFRAQAERQYEHAMEVLTDPRCAVRVIREYAGRDEIRIYVAFA